MAISLGRKSIKKLHKGSSVIQTIHKGDDLVYIDLESIYRYEFTIDTRLTTSGTLGTNATFGFYFGNVGTSTSKICMKVYWGDGTETVYNEARTRSYTPPVHTYPEPGEYKIKIVPTLFNGMTPVPGWLSMMGLDDANSSRIKSIDTPVPQYGMVFDGDYYNSQGRKYSELSSPDMYGKFYNLRNIESIPDGLLQNIIFSNTYKSEGGIYPCGMFRLTFGRFAYNSLLSTAPQMFIKLLGEVATMLNNFPFSTCTNTAGTFKEMFRSSLNRYIGTQGETITLPSLFSNISVPASTDCSRMFKNMFEYVLEAFVGKVIIPENFIKITAPVATTAEEMFDTVLSDAMKAANEVVMPQTLLSANMASVTNAKNIVSGVTQRFATASTRTLEIASSYFNFSFPSLRDVSSMYRSAFNGFANSPTTIKAGAFTIPQEITKAEETFKNLFADGPANLTIEDGAVVIENSSGCTSMKGMFKDFYNRSSSSPKWGQNLMPITQFDTSGCMNFSEMFYEFVGNTPAPKDGTRFPRVADALSDTSNGLDFSYMFYKLTGSIWGWEFVLGENYFSHVVTTNGTNFDCMFCKAAKTGESLKEGMFSTIDTTNGTSFNRMFASLTDGVTYNRVTAEPLQIMDIFADMPSYNWATKENVEAGVIDSALRCEASVPSNRKLVGDSSIILQHFPFTPEVRTKLFENQDRLDDYATLDANWK